MSGIFSEQQLVDYFTANIRNTVPEVEQEDATPEEDELEQVESDEDAEKYSGLEMLGGFSEQEFVDCNNLENNRGCQPQRLL